MWNELKKDPMFWGGLVTFALLCGILGNLMITGG